MTPLLTIIIPTINEESSLPLLLSDIRAQQKVRTQVFVADGGSTDNTLNIAAEHATVIQCNSGRAKQMNQAWRHPQTSEWLLFLHADSRLTCPNQLQSALAASQDSSPNTAGHFTLRFEHPSKSKTSFRYRFLAAKTATNRRYTINGDQGLLIRKTFLQELGGFDESLPFLEDQSIAEKIYTHGHWQILPGTLATSSRRFKSEGFAARYHLMTLMMVCWYLPLPDFFKYSSGLYKQQQATEKLVLTPFLHLLKRLVQNLPAAQKRHAIRHCGKFALKNVWQPFFLVDQFAFYPIIKRQPLTAAHDLMAKLLAKIPGIENVSATLAGRLCWYYLLTICAFTNTTQKHPTK